MKWNRAELLKKTGLQYKLGIWLIPLMLTFSGCIDEINLEGTGGGGGQLVVQGQVIKGCPSSVRVRVSSTADFAIHSLPSAVENAVIFLEDELGNQLSVPQTEPGVYQMAIEDDNSLISIEIGKSYSIRVTTTEGSQYQSSFDKIEPVPIADSVSIEMIDREELDLDDQRVIKQYMQFFIHTPLETNGSQQRSRMRWTFESVYRVDETPVSVPPPGPVSCYVTRGLNLDKVVVFNGGEANSTHLDNYFLVEDEIDLTFGLGYLLRINQHSLSSQAYDYWNKVSQAVSLSGGLFEAPPGEIGGNIFNINDPEEKVHGYFYGSAEYKFTRFVTREDAGSPKGLCSLDLFTGEQVCVDCEIIPFSTGEKPEDWGQ